MQKVQEMSAPSHIAINGAFDASELPAENMKRCEEFEAVETADTPRKKKDGKTSFQIVKHFALDVTTAHGFPNIFRAETTWGRLLWTLLFLVGLGVALGQVTTIILNFSTFPVNVEVICCLFSFGKGRGWFVVLLLFNESFKNS